MSKTLYSFDTLGVSAKMNDLYAGTEAEIEAEAVSVSSDFFAWLIFNFYLTKEQIAYMESLGTAFAESNGNDLAFAFRNRLDVRLTKGEISMRTEKFIRKEQNVTSVSLPGQESDVAGSIDYYIS
ncbi:hypothetical protein FAZ19_07325 [Sphingobacterium alkalisoli]|uniref:Uncharacterized protein n=1 Tax=Sphingobacterium alkalisoli TaxID=1874115 RepID=A0A4U0H8F9_9SPHI|nr:hypothetical protein [Sphingobacterium alkalisoli]TJY66722.1 hypothetical protein FAZ19_07325 [Sphingobacterium alkalisoli]GGH14614.1 hypothetical protein GCM10011418_15670 [Sphingobacterium alkalisoli]